MSSVKARKEGNSIVITLPSALGVKEGEEFFILKKDNGVIALIPKEEDHFADVSEGEYDMPELDAGYAPSEGELDDI